MEYEVLTTMIGTMGFPIVAYLLMFFKLEKTVDKLENTLQQLIIELGKGARENGN